MASLIRVQFQRLPAGVLLPMLELVTAVVWVREDGRLQVEADIAGAAEFHNIWAWTLMRLWKGQSTCIMVRVCCATVTWCLAGLDNMAVWSW